MKKSIEITPNIEALFGTRDENLHVLEDGLNINIDLRADRIDLEGAARDVARAEQMFSDFEYLRKSGHTFNNGDLNSMLRVLAADPKVTLRGPGRGGASAFARAEDCPAEEFEPEEISGSDRNPRHGVWCWSGRHRQDLPCGGHGDLGVA